MPQLANSKSGVIDLDAIAKTVAFPDLSRSLAASMTVSPMFQQLANVAASLTTLFEPIREAMKAFHEMVQRIIEPVKEMMRAYTQTFRFLTTFKPIYYIPAPVAPKYQTGLPDKYLTVEEAKYGFYKIDGHELTVLNPSSSRCGKILSYLLMHRATVVDYPTLREYAKSPNLDKDFKDLKRQLKQKGYVLDYDRPRGQGIALKGLIYLQ